MAELDYAFLADFARVEPNGTLTAVGASWTHIDVAALPSRHRMSVAGRVRANLDEGAVPLRIDLVSPGESFRITFGGDLLPSPGAIPYGDGKVGHLFALDMQIPLVGAGLYEVYIAVGAHSRRLAFEVAQPSSGPK